MSSELLGLFRSGPVQSVDCELRGHLYLCPRAEEAHEVELVLAGRAEQEERRYGIHYQKV